MDLGITGRWALVCGASKGLGFGCAQALASEGANVLIVARTPATLEQAAGRIRKTPGVAPATRVEWLAADIATPQGRSKVLSQREEFDILVTNAGGPPPGDFHEWEREHWLAALDANMLAPIELIKAYVDGMVARGFGRIVNITSGAVKAPIGTLGLSNGARAGLTGFVAGIARAPKLASRNVTINNLLPGAFDTDRLRSNMAINGRKVGKTAEEMMEARRSQFPPRRFGTPEEFGAICAFLCSAHASYIVGQNILADGGTFPGTF
jgi:3-oxoacyl-[acyl-carrier protein] reductase